MVPSIHLWWYKYPIIQISIYGDITIHGCLWWYKCDIWCVCFSKWQFEEGELVINGDKPDEKNHAFFLVINHFEWLTWSELTIRGISEAHSAGTSWAPSANSPGLEGSLQYLRPFCHCYIIYIMIMFMSGLYHFNSFFSCRLVKLLWSSLCHPLQDSSETGL